MKQLITAAGAPAAIGPYSPAVKVGNMLFLSGSIPLDPATGQLVEGGIREQATRVMWDPLESTCRHASLSIL